MEENTTRSILMPFLKSFSDIDYDADDFKDNDEPKGILYVTVGMLGFLSMSGTFGNIFVLYVYTRNNKKRTISSTLFILTLAGTDLISSPFNMPFTIFMETRQFQIYIDVLCKVYHGLATTSIPFSASVMVAIAVDRYICIVHPHRKMITVKRAKISVFLLAIFSICLGFPSSLMYGVNTIYVNNLTSITRSMFYKSLEGFSSIREEGNESESSEYEHISYDATNSMIHTVVINTGQCHKNELILDSSFFDIYQKMYSSYFAVCAVIVIVLYAIIYQSVHARRRRRFKHTANCCVFLSRRQNLQNTVPEQTENVKNDTEDGSSSLKSNDTLHRDSFRSGENQGNKSTAKKQNASKESVRLCGVSRAKMEKLKVANIKTALMLSIVALTYIFAFLPAWLMALKIVPMNAVVFYLYFTYNVANPIIYAFLNKNFRNHMETFIKCQTIWRLDGVLVRRRRRK